MKTNLHMNKNLIGNLSIILIDGLLWFKEKKPVMDWPLQDFNDACKISHRFMWRWMIENNEEKKNFFIVKKIKSITGIDIPGNCFACLYTCVNSTVIGLKSSRCVICPVKDIGCNEEHSVFKKYNQIKWSDPNKAIYAYTILNSWEEL